jgi:hypothetical protein
VTPAHRGRSTTTRRALLGAAAAVAVSGVAVGVHHFTARPADEETGAAPPPSRAPSAGGKPADTTSPAPVGRPGWGGPIPFQPGQVMLGAYLDLAGLSFSQALALRRRQLGRSERIIHLFYGFGDRLPSSVGDLPAGTIPMISWRGVAYRNILGGGSDSVITAAARNLAKIGKPVFLRWGWEMNGNWYPWGGPDNDNDPQGYVNCWRHLHQIFAAQGAHNVAWVWSINWNNRPPTATNRFQAYYPGDAYVDWVGMSGYDLGHEKPQALYDPLYNAYARQKPVFVTEVGAADFGGVTKGDFIRKFAAYVAQRPAIGAVTWFDTDTHPNAPYNWRIDANADSLAAFKAMAVSPRFAG